jgi:uncharacterized protein (DUF427 family)
MQAIWRDHVIADSNDTIIVEGNHYFPDNSLKKDFFEKSYMHTDCPWKGKASYYNLREGTEVDRNIAWYYPDPFPGAKEIRNYVAFFTGGPVELSY